jgi:predicted NUDIX family phosphoesterase
MILKSLPKHSETTYGVHPAILAEIVRDNAFTLMAPDVIHQAMKDLDQGVMGAVRSLIAKFDLLRQGIAYGLTYRIDWSNPVAPRLLFLVYKRNKKNANKELQSVFSLGAGGHIEGLDLSYHQLDLGGGEFEMTQAVDMFESMEDSFAREYGEEVILLDQNGSDITDLVIDPLYNDGFPKVGFVMDSSPLPGYVGTIHFGVVYAIHAADAVGFDMKEEMNDAVCWASADQLLSDPVFTGEVAFEPWSQMILDQIYDLEKHIIEHFVLETVDKAASAEPAVF